MGLFFQVAYLAIFFVGWFVAAAAIKSERFGANETVGKRTRIGRAFCYLSAIGLLLYLGLRFGAYGAFAAFVISFLLFAFMCLNSWALYGNFLNGRGSDTLLGKVSELAWSDDKIKLKAYLVKGDALPLLRWVRRLCFLCLLAVVIVTILFAGISAPTGAAATQQEVGKQPVTVSSTAGPANLGGTPSVEPTPKASPSASPVEDNCDAPSLNPSNDKSNFNAAAMQTCVNGDWVNWNDAHMGANPTGQVTVTAWTEEGGYFYGRISYPGEGHDKVLVRTNKF